MKKEWGDKIRLQHVLDAITETQLYINNVSFEEFMENSEKRYNKTDRDYRRGM